MSKFFYVTTTIPYVNADPHIGFALEIVQADIIARYKKLAGYEVFFNTGTDEHGIKVWRKASELGKETQEYVDESAAKYKELLPVLGISKDVNFIRTTSPSHKRAAEEFWNRCKAAGDIYKKNYKVKYCVGCELEKTDQEIENGRCPIHPNLELEIIEEENYFFRLSKYTDRLLELFSSGTFVVPDFRLNEIRSLIKEKGLEDFSVSRLKAKMPWGVSVPGDDNHVMYVWFDAFVNYISAIGWPEDMEKFNKWWPVVQLAGKDQVRQQAVMWQAMLMSVGIEPSKQIVIHGFLTSGGQKMSKSLGNVVDPIEIVNEYGTDALRYYLARHIHPFEDSDFTSEKFKESYNANLANGLGNLFSRVVKMSNTYFSGVVENVFREMGSSEKASLFLLSDSMKNNLQVVYGEKMNSYNTQSACDILWDCVRDADEYISRHEPFKLVKTDVSKTQRILWELLNSIVWISDLLKPILPVTAEIISSHILKSEGGFRTTPIETPLFPRK